jgi:thermitase
MKAGRALSSRFGFFSTAALLVIIFSGWGLLGPIQQVHAEAPSPTTASETPTGPETAVSTLEPTLTPPPLTSQAETPEASTPTSSLTPEPATPTSPETETPAAVSPEPDQPTVRLLVNLSKAGLASIRKEEASNTELEEALAKIGVFILEVPADQAKDQLTNWENQPGVGYAELDQELSALETIPNDPGWINQSGWLSIHAPQGWDLSTGSNAVTIAIVDTGVDYFHPEFMGKLLAGYDFVNLDADPQDDHGHGTHVAGIAAATGNNGLGLAGVAWGARLLPVKVLDRNGNGSNATAAAGIIWATDHGAQVINLSFGGEKASQVLSDAVQYAAARGVILVAAAGNTGRLGLLYPARYSPVIAVGAVDSMGQRAWFSNYGPGLDLVAPGVSIYSTVVGGYGYKNGTSMAAPFVSGLAAILRGLPLGTSPEVVTWQMQATAQDLGTAGWDEAYGSGLIQMDAAIRLALPPTPTPTSIPTGTTLPLRWVSPTRLVSTLPKIVASERSLATDLTPTLVNEATLTPFETNQLSGSTTPTRTPTMTPTLTSIQTISVEPVLSSEAEGSPLGLPYLGIGFILMGLLLAGAAIRFHIAWPRNVK